MTRGKLQKVIIIGALVCILILIYVLVAINNNKKDDLYASFPAKLESYYDKNGSYPLSLAQLEGVALDDVAKGTDIIYRVGDRTGRYFYSYDAEPATDDESIDMCLYEIDFQTTDSFGLNPGTEKSYDKSHCM